MKDVSFPAGAERNQWLDESVDLSAYASEPSLCIALRYTGKSNTYRIDNVGYGDGEAAPYLSISGSGTTVTSGAGSLTFQVSSNVAWTVASDHTDFTPAPASGEGQEQITVTYTANTTGEDRTAVITVIPGAMVPLTPAEEWAGRQYRGMESPLRAEYLARLCGRMAGMVEGLRRSTRPEDLEKLPRLEEALAGLNELKEEWDRWQR